MHTQHTEENELKKKGQDPRLVLDCLKQGGLKSLVEKAHLLLKLEQELRELIPSDYKNQCRVMNIDDTTLVVGVDSASRATRLRYQANEILEKLKANKPELCHLSALQIKVLINSHSR